MSGLQCTCRREFLKTLFFVGGAMGSFYIGHPTYVKKLVKEMDEIIDEGESIAKRRIAVGRLEENENHA